MAYDKSKLELLAGGGAVLSQWGYVSAADTKATIDTEGYFNSASSMLRVGDWVFINASDGYGIAVVSSNADGVVNITDAVAVGGADVD